MSESTVTITTQHSLAATGHKHGPYHPRSHIPSGVIMAAAGELANTLRQRGLHFAFCDDIAAFAYGFSRWSPRSIKVMVLLDDRSSSLSDLSEYITTSCPDKLRADKSPGIMTYRIASKTDSTRWQDHTIHRIRVQLIPTNRHPLHSGIFVVEGLPLVPFTFVLLERLREWDESNTAASNENESESTEGKRKVVMAMLRYFRSNASKAYCKPISAFDPSLHSKSVDRVTRFYETRPSYLPEWRKMGFMGLGPNLPYGLPGTGLMEEVTDADADALDEILHTSLSISNTSTPTPPLNPLPSAPLPSTRLFVKCTPRILELLHDWDNDPEKKEDAAREIEAFLISIRCGRQTLVTGSPQALDPLVHAQVHRFFSEHKVLFHQWQKMGFFEAYSSKTDVPPAPPKTDRGYFLPPMRVFNPSSTSLQDPSKPKAPLEKKGKLARKSARQVTFGESRLLAAQAVVSVLGDLGFNCAIFGSMACHLLGSPRLPNDVDILVLQPDTSMTQEEIKEKIIQHQPDHFFLHSARDPSATYRILHYRPTPDISSASKSIIKVDILLPGIMHLPFLTPTDITTCSGLPIIPYPVLLLQKLQAWDDHRLSEEERYRKKLPVDAKDVIWLLAPSNWEKVGPVNWNDRRLFEEGFEKLSRARVIAFCMAYPTTSELWSRLGFTTY